MKVLLCVFFLYISVSAESSSTTEEPETAIVSGFYQQVKSYDSVTDVEYAIERLMEEILRLKRQDVKGVYSYDIENLNRKLQYLITELKRRWGVVWGGTKQVVPISQQFPASEYPPQVVQQQQYPPQIPDFPEVIPYTVPKYQPNFPPKTAPYPEKVDPFPQKWDPYPQVEQFPPGPYEFKNFKPNFPQKTDSYPQKVDPYPQKGGQYPQVEQQYPSGPYEFLNFVPHFPQKTDQYPQKVDPYPQKGGQYPQLEQQYPSGPYEFQNFVPHFPQKTDPYPQKVDPYPQKVDPIHPYQPNVDPYPQRIDPYPQNVDPYPVVEPQYPQKGGPFEFQNFQRKFDTPQYPDMPIPYPILLPDSVKPISR